MTQPPHIDPERLAALLDGRLGDAEAAEIRAQLAVTDDDMLSAFADAVAIHDVKVNVGRSPVSMFGTNRRVVGALAIAASIAGVVLSASVLGRPSHSGDRVETPATYAQLLKPGPLPTAWNSAPWPHTRGASDGISTDALGVRAGARFTDVTLLIATHDSGAGRSVRNLAALVEDIQGAAPALSLLRDISGALASDRSPSESDLVHARTALAEMLGEEPFMIGSWLEAARIAASQRDAAFFTAPASRAAIQRITARAGDRASRNLLQQSLSNIQGSAIHWPTVEAALAKVLGLMAS